MRPDLACTVRNVQFHDGPDLDAPEGSFGPGVVVEVVERRGPSATLFVREQGGERQGWIPGRSVQPQ